MNYPIWQVPAGGLLIAAIAIFHVFISHFAVGGGLFLVLVERRARRLGDDALLSWLKTHSRFFILVTLVLGAVTGVAIWFAIGLMHPQATSALIQTFVWGWAIEWTFFLVEIAAAIVYYYGWDRLPPKTHLTVGWIYFAAAWLSLFVINGILTFMLTPGAWLATRGFWDAFWNPTFLPSLAARTLAAMGLAGLYALLTASWAAAPPLKARIARLAGLGWVVPMALLLPLSLLWYLAAASRAGVPVAEILGGKGEGLGAALGAVFSFGSASGYPMAQRGILFALVCPLLLLLLTLFLVTFRRQSYGRPLTALLMLLGILGMGGSEWVREDLRKPYVIHRYMFVNGIRLPAPEAAPKPPAGVADRFSLDALDRTGLLAATPWVRIPQGYEPGAEGASGILEPEFRAEVEAQAGAEVFRLLCSACHTVDGYNAVRPLVQGKSLAALDGVLDQLARPVDAQGKPAAWSDPGLRLDTWRGRQMPPFVGTEAEEHALLVYLARLGGDARAGVAPPPGLAQEEAAVSPGAAFYEENCSACHGDEADFPMKDRVRGRGAADFYELIGRLPQVNEMMEPFPGTDEERRAVAQHIADLGGPAAAQEKQP